MIIRWCWCKATHGTRTPSRPPGRRLAVGLLAGSLLLSAGAVQATNYYWNAADGLWGAGTNWSDNSASGGTTGVIPGVGDTAVFNQSSVNGAETIALGAACAVAGLTFNNTGTTLIQSDSSTSRTLSISNAVNTTVITVNSGAGAVTIGNANYPVSIYLGLTNQNGAVNWVNSSSTPLTIVGNIACLQGAYNSGFSIRAGAVILKNGTCSAEYQSSDTGLVESGSTLTLDHYTLTANQINGNKTGGIGLGSANNTVIVGAGSTLNYIGYFRLGTAGSGNNQLIVTNGGTFASSYRFDFGNNASNVAQVGGDGSTMTIGGNQVNSSGGTVKAMHGGLAYFSFNNGNKVLSTFNMVVAGTDPTTGEAAVLDLYSTLNLPAASNIITNYGGGLLEFQSAAPTVMNLANASCVQINGGGLSYKGVTSGLDWSVKPATFTWSGNNALRLNGSTDTGTVAYTFANHLGATNYTALQLYGTCAISRAITFDGSHGGALLFNGSTNTVSGGITLIGTVACTARGAASRLTGVIGGDGSLLKLGAGTLALASANTYSGATIVSNGVLRLTSSTALAALSSVYVLTGGALDLAFSGTNQVAALSINGSLQPNGTYGSNGSTLTGTGYLKVVAPLSPPTGLSAVGLNARILLMWNAVTNADSYYLYRSDATNGSYTAIYPVSATNFLDTSLTNGTSYWYAVQSTNSMGASALSAWVTATPAAPPPPAFLPGGGVSLNPATGAATISFNGTNGWQYLVEYTDNLTPPAVWTNVAGTTWLTAASNGTLTVTDAAATNSPQRFYRLEVQ